MANKRINIEILRIVSCMAVVAVHVVRQGILLYGGGMNAIGVNPFVNLAAFAVPCFLMITGWIWLDENRTYNLYKCIKKAIVPLFSFGFAFALMELVYNERTLTPGLFIRALTAVLTGDVWDHMWYLYTLIGIYIVLPVLKRLVQNWTERDWNVVFIVLLIFQIGIPTIEALTGSKIGFYLPIYEPYILYVLIGHYLPKKQMRFPLAVLNAAGSIAAILIYVQVLNKGTGYAHILAFWEGCALYQMAIAAGPYCEKIKDSAIRYVSGKTFGIYILHPVFINTVFKVLRFDPYSLPGGV